MPTSPRGFLDYPAKGDVSWYDKSEDGLEQWMERIEGLGLPSYDSFGDLPSAGTPVTIDGGTGKTQRQFAAVIDEDTIYRVKDDQSAWEEWAYGRNASATWDSSHTFNSGLTANGDIILSNNDLGDVDRIKGGSINPAIEFNGSDIRLTTEGTGSASVTVLDNANLVNLAEFTEGGPVKFPSTGIDLSGGSIEDTAGTLTISSATDITGGNLSLDGNTLQEIGGTTDASFGAIRMVNSGEIAWRNTANSNDALFQLTGNDNFLFTINGSNVLKLTGQTTNLLGNILSNVGGTTSPNSGAIRLANNTSINARNDADDGDFGITFDSNDEVTIDTRLNAESVSAEKLTKDQGVITDRPVIGSTENIPEWSQSDEDIYVDPVNGDDSAEGSETDPIKTLTEAESRIPFNVQHQLRIILFDGDYTSQDGLGFEGRFVSPREAAGLQILGHTSESPLHSGLDKTAVKLPQCYNLGHRGSEEIEYQGLTMDGQYQFYQGATRFEQCILANAQNNSVGADNATLTGYLGSIQAKNCDFADANAILNATINSDVHLQSCTVGNNGTVPSKFGNVSNGAQVSLEGSDELISQTSNPSILEGSRLYGGPKHPTFEDTGSFTTSGGANAFKAKENGSDIAFYSIYADSANPSSRSGFVGFASGSSDDMFISNELGSDIRYRGLLKLLDATTQPGTASNPAIEIGDAGAGFFVNGSGEIEVVDEAGNTTTIS